MLSKALLNIVRPRPLMIASQRCSSGKSAMGFSENTDAANSSQYVVSQPIYLIKPIVQDSDFSYLSSINSNDSRKHKKSDAIEVPWFPQKMEELDNYGKRVLVFGDGIEEIDHPGCNDPEYRARRKFIGDIGINYKLTDGPIPRIEYTKDENWVWSYCYARLNELYQKRACKEYLYNLDQFEKKIGFSPDRVPQLEDISQFLMKETGWRLKPVGGLLTQREFLNGLAFRVFHST